MGKHRFAWDWTLKDANFTRDKGKVFSCFACGGGSTMGYKLAGFDVIGCNEIDKDMIKVYEMNHHPAFAFNEGIQTFKMREDLPRELFDLDILDGSPPCSAFSMSGLREKAWGKERHFKEGQAAQVLDTLFFDFIDLAARLRPKVVIAENVKGLLCGNAKKYVERIYDEFDKAGYTCQHFLLNASAMGVPQKRERTFFLCLRKDLAYHIDRWSTLTRPYIDMKFNEAPVLYSEIASYDGRPLQPAMLWGWERKKQGDRDMAGAFIRETGVRKMWNTRYVYKDEVISTVTTHNDTLVCFDKPMYLSAKEIARASTFPSDYDFGECKPWFACGMSVPPVMMAQVATRVSEHWLTKLNV